MTPREPKESVNFETRLTRHRVNHMITRLAELALAEPALQVVLSCAMGRSAASMRSASSTMLGKALKPLQTLSEREGGGEGGREYVRAGPRRTIVSLIRMASVQ